MSYERMQKEEARLESGIGELLAAALHGEGVRGDEAPDALRGRDGRLAAIREAKARLDAEGRRAAAGAATARETVGDGPESQGPAGNGDRPDAPWASPSRRPKATRRTRRAGS